MEWMNLLFYIGGFPLWIGCMMVFWDLDGSLKRKEHYTVVLKATCLIALWVWICWKIS